jgi:hypothetical protein
VSAFVQLNLDVWTAWQTGTLTTEERDLALYVAFEADFRTGLVSTTLDELATGLRWKVARTTTARRLANVVREGFLEARLYGRRPHQRHVLAPTSRLLRTSHLTRENATRSQLFATPDATLEAALARGFEVPGATPNAIVEEKLRDISKVQRELQDVAGERVSESRPREPVPISDEVLAFMRSHGMRPPSNNGNGHGAPEPDDELVECSHGYSASYFVPRSQLTCRSCGYVARNPGGRATHERSCRRRT